MTTAAMLRAAGEAFEAARLMGAGHGEAMDLALRELASCRQRNRSQGIGGKPVPLSVPARAVIDAVLLVHGLTVADVVVKSRIGSCARLTKARDEAVYLARRVDPDATYPALAALFGRDHASIIHGQRTFAKRLETDELLATRVRRVMERPQAEEGAADVQASGGVA